MNWRCGVLVKARPGAQKNIPRSNQFALANYKLTDRHILCIPHIVAPLIKVKILIFYKLLHRYFIAFSVVFLLLMRCTVFAQPKKSTEKKYTSILWEITGKGIQKPSYLFGTMHISNKMVFNLGDSFYHAIEHCDMVGLELDPGYWQAHFSKQQADAQGYGAMAGMMSGFADLDRNTSLYKSIFSVDPYDKSIEYALASEPTMINSLLYRKNEDNQEHEEDTYLDLYLYQICNKLSKKIVGLEQIDSSERMLREAQMALREDKNQRSYDREDYASPLQIQDAYKNGDLDLVDSLDRKSTPNKKYRAIFLDHRNEIQATSIDSVLKLHHTIFAGVGCAHLPGENGVIETLRKMGYKMRPVKMNIRNGNEKDRIDKIRYPVKFATQYTVDSVVKVDIPGTWFRFSNRGNVLQYADLANGSYYMLNRVATDALFQNQNTADVLEKVDSLLYENIPGKIISKTSIVKNGYKGFDITNRTRRGDVQRFQILVTPFEVIVAKMSASMDYVLVGTEANTFFNSLSVRTLEQNNPVHFTPTWGGFSVDLPHYPYIKNRQNGNAATPAEFSATDKQKGISYLIMKETVPRTSFIEEDTFELNLMNESYMSSKVFDKLLYKKIISQNGYPALEASYKLKDSNYAMARFVIQGGQYYAIVAQQKTPFIATPATLSSFSVKPFIYQPSTLQKDTAFGYSLLSPQKLPTIADQGAVDDYMKVMAKEQPQAFEMIKRIKAVSLKNDSTGESIQLLGVKMPPYTYLKDSSFFNPWQSMAASMGSNSIDGDTSYIFRKKVKTKLNNWDVYESVATDTNSSRQLHNKLFYKQGVIFCLSQYGDTLSTESSFSKDVFTSFKPADSLQGPNIFEPKGNLFFSEYASADSTTHTRALSNLSGVTFQKSDVPKIAGCLKALQWNEPNYLGIKKRFIQALDKIEDTSATSLLKHLYEQANDTALYQQQILASLIDQQTSTSFKVFEELVTNNPPVDVNTSLGDQQDGIRDMGNLMASLAGKSRSRYHYSVDDDGNASTDNWSNITDSMNLAKQILPGILTLMNLDDYKEKIQSIAFEMADSGYVSAQEMQPFYTKFLLEAKHEYKKALAQESTDNMKKKAASVAKEKAGSGDDDDATTTVSSYRYKNTDANSYDDLYEKIVLLTPFYATQQSVRDLVQQSFSLQSKNYRYDLFKMMLRKNLKAYPDTLPNFFAKDVEMREKFYNYLSKRKELKLFPAEYKMPSKLAEAKLFGLGNSKPDTFALVATRPFILQQDTGTIYFYKVKWKKTDQWKWAMISMEPAKKAGEWTLSYDEMDKATRQKLDDTKTTDEQIDTLLKETLSSKRLSAKSFYGAGTDYDNDDMMGLIQRMRR